MKLRNFLEDNQVLNYKEVKKMLEEGTHYTNFGSYERSLILKEGYNGLIRLSNFFEGGGGGNVINVKDIEDINEYELLDAGYTYNYNGYLERDVRYYNFKNIESDEVITFYSVHIGLDARAGFTPFFAIEYFDEYHQIEHLTSLHELSYITLKDKGGKVYNVSIYGSVASEELTITISKEYEYMDDIFTWIDTTDKDMLKEELEELLEEELGMKLKAVGIE